MFHLSEQDHEILRRATHERNVEILKEMPIFSKNYKYQNLDIYNYVIPNDDEEIYYIGLHFNIKFSYAQGRVPLFINQHKQIIMHATQLFHFCVNILGYHRIVELFNSIYHVLNTVDFSNYVVIDKNIVGIQKWTNIYGHYKDEIFCLQDFYSKYPENSDYIPFFDYEDNLTENYKLIDSFLFDNKSFNPYSYGKKILKFNKLILVEHHILLDTFHLFPKSSTNKILSNISDNYDHEIIFITRSNNTFRRINNMHDVENFVRNKGVKIINPEHINYLEFIKNITKPKTIFITWGSALVNLIFTKPNAKIVVLRSHGYGDETLHIFRNLIKNYNLDLDIVHCKHGNNIDLNDIEKYII